MNIFNFRETHEKAEELLDEAHNSVHALHDKGYVAEDEIKKAQIILSSACRFGAEEEEVQALQEKLHILAKRKGIRLTFL